MGAHPLLERGDRADDGGVTSLEPGPQVHAVLVLFLACLEGVVVHVLARVRLGELKAVGGERRAREVDALANRRRGLLERAGEPRELERHCGEEVTVFPGANFARHDGGELLTERGRERIDGGADLGDDRGAGDIRLALPLAEPLRETRRLETLGVGTRALEEGAELLLDRAGFGGVALEGADVLLEREEGDLVVGELGRDFFDLERDRAERLAREAINEL